MNHLKNRRHKVVLCVLLQLLLLVAVGGCQSPVVTCEHANEEVVGGVCQPIACQDEKCPEGSYCDSEHKCQLDKVVACQKDIDCGDGRCKNHQCVNPSWCHFNSECMPGYSCDTQVRQCRPSPCPDGCRSGGICNTTTKKCESADSCTEATASIACAPGTRCISNKCISGTDFCNTNPCHRGQCSPTDFLCYDAPNCYGNDKNCLPGHYCDQTTCQVAKCDSKKSGCEGGRGICNSSNGICENAEACKGDDDCLSGYRCLFSEPVSVTGRTGKCLLEGAESCSPACEGNQICTDKGDHTFQCEEPHVCQDTLDCLGDRLCTKKAAWDELRCSPPVFCSEAHKGTETAPTTIVLNSRVSDVLLCQGSDYYQYEAKGLQPGEEVVIQLDIRREEVGVGRVSMKVTSSELGFLAKSASIAADGSDGYFTSIRFVPKENETYRIEVTSDANEHRQVHYTLSASSLSPKTADSCSNVKPLILGKLTKGNIVSSSTQSMKDCFDIDGSVREEIWRLHISKESKLNISVSGNPDFDAKISLRRHCDDTNDSLVCVNNGGNGVTESLWEFVQPGDYYVVVQGNDLVEAPYTILAEASPVICSPKQYQCQSDTFKYCAPDRDKWLTKTCVNGCSSEGYCNEFKGLQCLFGDKLDPSKGVDEDITLPDSGNMTLSNDCGEVKTSKTTYGEHFYRVTVPKGHALSATVTSLQVSYLRKSEYVLYLLSDCDAGGSHCMAKEPGFKSSSSGSLFWFNNGATRVVYLVVDSGPTFSRNIDKPQKAHLKVDVKALACQPESHHCNGNVLQVCRTDGSGYDDYVTCANGCQENAGVGSCVFTQGNRCEDAIELADRTKLGPYQLKEATDDIPYISKRCGSVYPSSPIGKEDMVFKAHADHVGDRLKVTVTPNSSTDVVLWGMDACQTSVGGTCVDGSDNGVTGDKESIEIVSDADNKDYYFVVQGDGDGVFDIELEKKGIDPGCVDHGKVLVGKVFPCQNKKMYYCDKDGFKQAYPCASCVDNKKTCDIPIGAVCDDAVVIDTTGKAVPFAGQKTSQDLSSIEDIDVLGTAKTGNCFFEANKTYDSRDQFYQFKLDPHRRLEVVLRPKKGYGSASSMKAYFVKDCASTDHCIGSYSSGAQLLAYETGVNPETIYLAIDRGDYSGASSYDLEWRVSLNSVDVKCQPGSFQCVDGKAQSVSYCDHGMEKEIICPGSMTCSNGACLSAKGDAQGTTCADPVDLTTISKDEPRLYYWSTSSLKETLDSSCSKAKGKVRYFKVDVNKGETIVVDGGMVEDGKGSAYIFRDCANADHVCDAVADGDYKDKNIHLSYTVPSDGVYYIAIAPQSDKEVELYSTISILPVCTSKTTCSPGSASKNAEVHYCSQGKEGSYTCPSSDCDGTLCKVDGVSGAGDSCFAARPLVGAKDERLNESFNLSSKFTLKLPYQYPNGMSYIDNERPAYSGACLFNRAPDLLANYYSIHLEKGDHLHVDVDGFTDDSISLYLLNDCLKQHCVTNDTQMQSLDNRTIDYIAPATATYYVVVGSAQVSSSSKYGLHWSVEAHGSSEQGSLATNSQACAPYASQCFLEGGKVHTHTCLPSGKGVVDAECPEGTSCNEGICFADVHEANPNKGIDACVDGKVVTVRNTLSVAVPYASLSNKLDRPLRCEQMNSAASAYKDKVTKGKDAVFQVVIPDGQAVRVWVKSSDKHDEMVYSTYDTCDLSDVCHVGGVYAFKHPGKYEEVVTLLGKSGEDKTLYLVLDSFSGQHPSYAKNVYFEYYSPTCLMSDKRCSTTSGELLYCDAYGVYKPYQCHSGTCDKNACQNPTGDSCQEAISIDRQGSKTFHSTYSGTFQSRHNTFSTTKKSLNCSGEESEGNDVVYSVRMDRGEILTASVTGSGIGASQDLSIYALSSCNAGVVNACLAGSDSSGFSAMSHAQQTEKITYSAKEDGEIVYIVVDSVWRKLTSDYTLDIQIKP